MTAARKRYLVWGIRIAVSATVLTIIFQIVPFREILQVAQRLPTWLWVAGFALFLVGHGLTAAKWWMLIGADIPFGRAFRAHLAGLGANLALPGVAGGDVVRAALVLPAIGNKGRLAVGSLADRLVDTISLALVALVGAWFAFHSDWKIAALAVGILALIFTGSIFMLRRFSEPVSTFALRHAGDGKLGRILVRVCSVTSDLCRRPGLLLGSLLLSIFVQCLFVGINIAFAWALGMTIRDSAWFYAWAGAKIIAILPISLGGLGVREASMAALLKPFGADYGAVIAVGLLWQTVLYASGLLGVIIQSGFSTGLSKQLRATSDHHRNTGQV